MEKKKIDSLSCHYYVIFMAASVLLLLLVAIAGSGWVVAEAAAVTCNPVQLSPCLLALTSPAQPSVTCCNSLRQQRPCLCEYLRNPQYKRYIDSPNAKRVSATCGVPFPKC